MKFVLAYMVNSLVLSIDFEQNLNHNEQVIYRFTCIDVFCTLKRSKYAKEVEYFIGWSSGLSV